MRELIRSWTAKDENGASAVEYGLLVAGIAAIIVLVVFAFGGIVKSVFSKTCTNIGGSAGVSTSKCTGV